MNAIGFPIWLAGILLCLTGSTFTALGLVIQKYSHVKNSLSETPTLYYKQFWWIVGFIIFLVAQLLNLAAMGMTPQVMLSCLGAWSLIFNAVFASLILDENLSHLEKAMFVITLFGVFCVINGTPTSAEPFVQGLPTMNAAFQSCAFLSTSVALLVILSVLVCTAKLSETLRPIAWAVVSAILSGYAVMFFKCVALLIPMEHAWRVFESFMILAFAGGVGLGQVHSMNLGLRAGEALVVVPIYYALGMMCQILTGAVFFRELASFSGPVEFICFWGGVAMLIVSIFVMTQSRISSEIEDGGLPASESSSLLLDDTSSPLKRLRHRTLSERSIKSRSPSMLDAEVFSESFGLGERTYVVSVAGPMGIA